MTSRLGICSVFCLVAAWQLSVSAGLVSPMLFPAPSSVFEAFWDVVRHGYRDTTLLGDLAVTVGRCLAGFLAAMILGVPLGLAMGRDRRIAAVFDYLIQFLRPLPPLSYMVLLILWFGIGEGSKVALLFLTAFPIIVSAAMAGVRTVPTQRLHAAASLGASPRQAFWHVALPSALPFIMTGAKIALAAAFSTVVAAEFLAARSGLGWMVLSAGKYLQNALIIVGIILLGLVGMALGRLLHVVDRRFVHWRRVG